MSGSATFTIVMSSSSMNVATQTAISVHHLRHPSTYERWPRGSVTRARRRAWRRRSWPLSRRSRGSRITLAICCGRHPAWSARRRGIDARLAGVSITHGRIALARTPVVAVLGVERLDERQHRRLATRCSRPRPRTGAAPRARRRTRSRRRRPRSAAAARRCSDQVGRAQVERELALEVLDRRLVHAPAREEPPTRLTTARSGAPARPPRRRPRARPRRGSNRSACDELEALAGSTRSSSRSATHGTTTRQPSARKRLVTAAPRPPVPPVISRCQRHSLATTSLARAAQARPRVYVRIDARA